MKDTSSQRVYNEIKNMVINYDIKPSQQINIDELALFLNVSVTPTREALNRLLNDGLVVRKNSRGFFNRDLNIIELTELFQIRGFLAISAFHHLHKNGQQSLVLSMLEELANSSPVNQLPLCFSMINATKNKEMLRIYNNVMDKIIFVWRVYSSSDIGMKAISQYRNQLHDLLINDEYQKCVKVIDKNIDDQINALSDTIKYCYGMLYTS